MNYLGRESRKLGGSQVVSETEVPKSHLENILTLLLGQGLLGKASKNYIREHSSIM